MTVNLVQQYDYSCKFLSCVTVDNSFIFSTDQGLLIVDLLSDFFRQSADYKVSRTFLPYSKEKPFDDKNLKPVRFEEPSTCLENNLAANPDNANWSAIYMGSHSNIVFLEKDNKKWIEKLSDIPHKWFLVVMKNYSFVVDQKDLKLLRVDNIILSSIREREKTLHIKNFVLTHVLKHENETKVYGTICCHLNDTITFWLTKSEKSTFLGEFKYHSISIKCMKWFKISNELSWLMVTLTNGQIYVHEICDYPHVKHTFVLWSDEDFSFVNNVTVETISNDQCLIIFTKMSFVLVILYSLSEKKIVSTKKEMIPKTVFLPGFTFVKEKKLLIVVTDSGKFVCMFLTATKSEVSYCLKTIRNNFEKELKYLMCTSVLFSKNQCACLLAFECTMHKYSKYDAHIKNKLFFCVVPENLVEFEKKIISVNSCNYNDVIDCIESLRVHEMLDETLDSVHQLDRKMLDQCDLTQVKLTYWRMAFKSKKTEHDENLLQELQMLIHCRYLINRVSEKILKMKNAEKYYCRVLLSYYMSKLPVGYIQVKKAATNLICSFIEIKHTYFCNTCQKIIVTFTDFRMFICEHEHKELRCPVTLGSLGMPCLVCSMCFTMANINAKNESCVWCFGEYLPNKLML